MSQILTAGAGQGVQVLASGGDPNFASVSLLCFNDNAADTSTTFIDQSSLGLSLTAVGNAQYDSAQSPTGMTTSALFDGTGDAIRLPVNAALTLGADFTIEAFVRMNANDNDTYMLGYDLLIRNAQCRMNQSGTTGRFSMYDGSANPISTANGSSWSNVWRHTAYSRSGSNITFWQDGTQIGNAITNSGTFDYSGLLIAGAGSGGPTQASMNGWLCSLRITKGVARYTANFTPPTLPLPTS